MTEQWQEADLFLFPPAPVWDLPGSQRSKPRLAGTNHPAGLQAYFHVPEDFDLDTAWLKILDANGQTVRKWTTSTEQSDENLEIKSGANAFQWDLTYPSADQFDGMILWWGSLAGPKALPGDYSLTLHVGQDSVSQPFQIRADPRLPQDGSAQMRFRFLQEVNELLSEAHRTIRDLRLVREQITAFTSHLPEDSIVRPIRDQANTIVDDLTDIEEALYQTKNRSQQDPLNFPIRLTNKLAHLNSITRSGPYAPTDQAWQVKEELSRAIRQEVVRWTLIRDQDLPALNARIRTARIDIIRVPVNTD